MTVVGQQLINSVRAKAAENPDFIYSSPFNDYEDIDQSKYGACVYIHNGCGSCIIGQVLLELGLINPSLEDSADNNLPIPALLRKLNIELDLSIEELVWLRDVQNYQDTHHSWSEAVVLADKHALERLLKAGIG